MGKILKIIFALPVLFAICYLLFVGSTFAASGSGGGSGIGLTDPLGGLNCGTQSQFQCVATAIINALFTITIPIVAIMILIGGFQIFTAAGNAEQAKKGKTTITYAVIGFVVVLLAQALATIIKNLG